MLSAGGVPVPPVPLGVARRMAITNHYYFELTPEQRRNYGDPDDDSDDGGGEYDDYSGEYYRCRQEHD